MMDLSLPTTQLESCSRQSRPRPNSYYAVRALLVFLVVFVHGIWYIAITHKHKRNEGTLKQLTTSSSVTSMDTPTDFGAVGPSKELFEDDDDNLDEEDDNLEVDDDDNDTDDNMEDDELEMLELLDYDDAPFRVGTVQYFQAENLHEDLRDARIPYFCDGRKYKRFAQKMRDFAEDKIESGVRPSTWGKRGLPPNSRVLVFGQSHTRQVGVQLAMQHDLPLPQVEFFDQHLSGKMARRFDLGQNRSLYVVANSYVAFSKDWKFFLERQIQIKMEQLDAVFVSVWNRCTAAVNTNFKKEMLAMSEQLDGVDCAHNPGPTVVDIAQAYQGPIAFVSMFAKYRDDDVAEAWEMVQELKHNRTNVDFIDARQYINEMGLECGAPKVEHDADLPDCDNTEEAGEKYHRCVGALGGHPDMIAWDVNEYVWKYFDRET